MWSFPLLPPLPPLPQPSIGFFQHEWVIVTLIGGLGGMAATLFSQQTSSARKGQPQPHNSNRPKEWSAHAGQFFRWLGNLLLNISGGAMASFILWATYTSSFTFDSAKISPSEAAAALTVRLGGVSTVRRLIHETAQAKEWESAAQVSMDAAADLEDAQAPNPDTLPSRASTSPIDVGQPNPHTVNREGVDANGHTEDDHS